MEDPKGLKSMGKTMKKAMLNMVGAFALVSVLAGGCATQNHDMKTRLDELSHQNVLLTGKVDELSRRLAMMESNVTGKANILMVPPDETEYPLFPGPKENPDGSVLTDNIGGDEMPLVPDLTVVKLMPPPPDEVEIDDTDITDDGFPVFEKVPTPADLDDIDPDTLFGMSYPKSKPPDKIEKKSDKKELSEAAGRFEKSLAHYESKDYKKAETGFKELLQKHPDSKYADSAHYWLGESHYAQEKYDLALGEFKSVIRDYPNSSKAPESLLKLHYCFMERGEKENAWLTLKRLTELYPYSSAAKIARDKLRLIK